MRAFYEDLWERLPAELVPGDAAARLAFLRSELRPGLRVLDVGCGAGFFTREIAAAGAQVVGVDVAQGALARASAVAPGADLRLAEFDGPLPVADEAFDLVWAGEVIEHVADTHAWLGEVHRALAPGGRLLVTTPNHPRLAIALRGLEHYADPLGDHLHLYTRRSLRSTLSARGFAAVEIRGHRGPAALARVLFAKAVRR